MQFLSAVGARCVVVVLAVLLLVSVKMSENRKAHSNLSRSHKHVIDDLRPPTHNVSRHRATTLSRYADRRMNECYANRI